MSASQTAESASTRMKKVAPMRMDHSGPPKRAFGFFMRTGTQARAKEFPGLRHSQGAQQALSATPAPPSFPDSLPAKLSPKRQGVPNSEHPHKNSHNFL